MHIYKLIGHFEIGSLNLKKINVTLSFCAMNKKASSINELNYFPIYY